MRKYGFLSILLALCLCMTACLPQPQEETVPPTQATEVRPVPLPTDPAEPETTVPMETEPEHSAYYVPDYPVDAILSFFNEVALNSEFAYDPENPAGSLVRKWTGEIRYYIAGDATQEDRLVVQEFMELLGSIPGVPAIVESSDPYDANFTLNFCSQEQLMEENIFADEYTDGFTTIWWQEDSLELSGANVYISLDVEQRYRSRVIRHEIYQSFGMVQDSSRPDSIIYCAAMEADTADEIDLLIITLLYHEDIQCGMDAAACEEIIRQLYY